MFKWKEGRQGTGYYKMKLFESKLLKFDVYILKMEENANIFPPPHIPDHYDKVEGYKHHRLNVILKRPIHGGRFRIQKKGLYWYEFVEGHKKRMHYFRPDLEKHGVTFLLEGTRYVISIGWLTK